jgi:hypothetical protein
MGQVVLFASHLPLVRGMSWLVHLPAAPGVSLFFFAIALAMAGLNRNVAGQSFDRLWLDFRDLYGLLWGLRLQERVNAASHAAGWGIELQWPGLSVPGIPPQHQDALRQAMTGLLRRFVSHEWIASRLEQGVD